MATIGFSLIAPLAVFETEANLPACCRRNGAHHCAMNLDRPEPNSGVGFTAAPRVCPSFPAAMARTGSSGVVLPGPAAAIFTAPLAQSFLAFRIESRFRASFRYCPPKRGPPLTAA